MPSAGKGGIQLHCPYCNAFAGNLTYLKYGPNIDLYAEGVPKKYCMRCGRVGMPVFY